jgi:hypothetical protein
LLEYPFPLPRAHGELGEAVDRSVKSKKNIKDSSKRISAGTGKLILVKIDFDSRATRERDAVFGREARKVRTAAETEDAFDLFIGRVGLAEIMQAENLFEGIDTFGNQR